MAKKEQKDLEAEFAIGELPRLVKWATSCAARESSRPTLTGVLTEFTKTGGRFITADGFRLLVLPFGKEQVDGPEEEILGRALIPAKAFNQNAQQYGKDYAKESRHTMKLTLHNDAPVTFQEKGSPASYTRSHLQVFSKGEDRWDKDKVEYVEGAITAKAGMQIDSIPGYFPNWRGLLPAGGYSEAVTVLAEDAPAWLAAFKAGEVWDKAHDKHRRHGIFRMKFSEEDRVEGSMLSRAAIKDEKDDRASYDLPGSTELGAGETKRTALQVSYLRNMVEVAGGGGFTVSVKDQTVLSRLVRVRARRADDRHAHVRSVG